MDPFAVTLVTTGRGLGHRWNRPDLMTEGSMAIRTFDLMVCDMILMDELRGKFGVQYFWFIMALDALSFGDMAIALNDTEMALFTGHTS